jgi:endonuclease/exonuclease/phosphatase (EEP) superfamily protein YafD
VIDGDGSSAPAGAKVRLPGLSREKSSGAGAGRAIARGRKGLGYGVIALVALFGGVTLISLLERWVPYLELATVFRLQYAVLLGAAALAAILLRRFRLALVALVLAGVNVLVISQVAIASSPAIEGSARLRVLIANVDYANRDYDRLARLIEETDPDLVGLTELTPAWVDGLEPALAAYQERRLEPQEGAYGIGVYSKVPLADLRTERFPADGPPSVVATVDLHGRPVDLVLTHIHTPFAGDIHERQLEALAKARPRLGDRLAVCGDFNTVPWSHSLRALTENADLRSIHGRFGVPGTWPTGTLLLRVPIDNCLVSDGVAAADSRVGPDIGSDHFPVIVDLALARDS